MAKKKSRKRGWSGAPATRPGGTTRPPGSTTRPTGTATTPTDAPEMDDGPALGATKTAPIAAAKRSPAPATSPPASNRVARKEEARRQREIIRRKEARRRAFRRYGTIAGIAVVVVGLVVILVVSNGAKGKHRDPRSLPGITTDNAPWPPEVAHLSDRIAKMGLPPLGTEALAYHIHQNLQVYVHGVLEPVPNGIGAISSNELAEIHTHTNSGTIHVEAGATRHYTLGDVFDVWGVLFTPDQLGSYTNDGGDKIRVYVGGKLVTTDPTLVPLRDQEVIVVTYGTASEVPSPVPSVFRYDKPPLVAGAPNPSGPTGVTGPTGATGPSGTSGATTAPATSAPATTAPTTAPATTGAATSGPTG